MNCPAHNPRLSESACPERILSITDNRDFALCAECERGRALMATVKDKFFRRVEEEMQEQSAVTAKSTEETDMLKESQTETRLRPEQPIVTSITLRELADLAGVPKGTAAYVYSCRKNGQPANGPKAQKLDAALKELGLSWESITPGQPGGRPRGNKKKDGASLPAAPAPAPAEVFDHGPDAPEFEPAAPAPAPAPEASEAQEPEPAAPEAESADLPGPLEQAFAQALAGEGWQPEQEAASKLDQAVGEALAQGARVHQVRFPAAEERLEQRSACFDLAVETALRLAPVEALMEALKERLPHARVSIQL